MKNVAFIYSGDDTGLTSLEHNKNGVAQKLKAFGDWEISEVKKLDTKSTFTQDLQQYQDDEIDSLLIYYTGHGIKRTLTEKFNLKLSSVEFVSIEELYEIVYEHYENSEALLPEKIAIVVDACYSGQAIYDTQQFGNSEILTSSLAHQQSFEKNSPSKMSLFSHYFCEAIDSLQSSEEDINLFSIKNYINGHISVQKAPYSLLRDTDVLPMTIAKGNLKEEYFSDVEVIYVYVSFSADKKEYKVLVNHEHILNIQCDKFVTEKIQKQIIDKIKSLIPYLTDTRVELMLPKDLYSKTLALWREQITPHCEMIIRSENKFSMAQNYLGNLKIRWNKSFDVCKNMSFTHKNVTVRVENEAMQDATRISALVETKVENIKVFEGIDQYYFIALWINSCDNAQSYQDMIKNIATTPLCDLSKAVRKEIVNNAKECSSNVSFMWDDPHTYQKEKRYG